MPPVDDITRVRHIIGACETALEVTKGRKRADLDRDVVLGLALVRLVEVIGEAAWGVSEGLRARHPDVPWRDIVAMRNRLIHGYFDVNLDRVWDTITSEVPHLLSQMKELLSEESP